MVHILYVPTWHPSPIQPGRGPFVADQILGQMALGHTVGVIQPCFRSLRQLGYPGPRQREPFLADAAYPVIRTSAYRVPWEPMYRLQWIKMAIRLFGEYVHRYGKPDLIHAHGSMWAGAAAQRIADRTGIPYLLTEHSSKFLTGRLPHWGVRMAKPAFRSAACCVAVSKVLAKSLQTAVAAGPVEVIPNSVDPDRFPIRRTEQAGPFTFAMVGGLVPIKGHQDLLAGFARAFQGRPEYRLVLVGDGPERKSLQGQALDLGIATQVEFAGSLERSGVSAVLRDSDALVVASHHETFSVAVIEALATGLPVLSTRCGGPEEILDPGDGWLVGKEDGEALVQGLRTAARDARSMAPADIRARAIARFGMAAIASRYQALYNALLARRDW